MLCFLKVPQWPPGQHKPMVQHDGDFARVQPRFVLVLITHPVLLGGIMHLVFQDAVALWQVWAHDL